MIGTNYSETIVNNIRIGFTILKTPKLTIVLHFNIDFDIDIEKDKDKENYNENATIHVMIDITVTWELWTQDSIHNSYDVSFDISHFGGDLKHL